jgi:uncharacterized protein YprB with RNaseH-like and TPR domain
MLKKAQHGHYHQQERQSDVETKWLMTATLENLEITLSHHKSQGRHKDQEMLKCDMKRNKKESVEYYIGHGFVTAGHYLKQHISQSF